MNWIHFMCHINVLQDLSTGFHKIHWDTNMHDNLSIGVHKSWQVIKIFSLDVTLLVTKLCVTHLHSLLSNRTDGSTYIVIKFIWVYLQFFFFDDQRGSIFDFGVHVVVLIADCNMKIFLSETHLPAPLICTRPIDQDEVGLVLAVLHDSQTHIRPVIRNFLNKHN